MQTTSTKGAADVGLTPSLSLSSPIISLPPATMSSSRVGLRFFQNARAAFRQASAPFRRPGAQGRRFQSSEAGSEKESTFQRMWNSPIGVKTVHFWCVPRCLLVSEGYDANNGTTGLPL